MYNNNNNGYYHQTPRAFYVDGFFHSAKKTEVAQKQQQTPLNPAAMIITAIPPLALFAGMLMFFTISMAVIGVLVWMLDPLEPRTCALLLFVFAWCAHRAESLIMAGGGDS
jgi:hypothetical protein